MLSVKDSSARHQGDMCFKDVSKDRYPSVQKMGVLNGFAAVMIVQYEPKTVYPDKDQSCILLLDIIFESTILQNILVSSVWMLDISPFLWYSLNHIKASVGFH